MNEKQKIYAGLALISLLGLGLFVKTYGINSLVGNAKALVLSGLFFGGLIAAAAFFLADYLHALDVQNRHDQENRSLKAYAKDAKDHADRRIESMKNDFDERHQALDIQANNVAMALERAKGIESEAARTVAAMQRQLEAAERKKFATAGYAQRLERRVSKNTNE